MYDPCTQFRTPVIQVGSEPSKRLALMIQRERGLLTTVCVEPIPCSFVESILCAVSVCLRSDCLIYNQERVNSQGVRQSCRWWVDERCIYRVGKTLILDKSSESHLKTKNTHRTRLYRLTTRAPGSKDNGGIMYGVVYNVLRIYRWRERCKQETNGR